MAHTILITFTQKSKKKIKQVFIPLKTIIVYFGEEKRFDCKNNH